MSKKRKKQSFALSMTFSLAVLAVLLISLGIAALVVYIFDWTGLLDLLDKYISITNQVVILIVVMSVTTGFGLAFAAMRIPLKPINRLIEGLERLAEGDFKARISIGGPFGNVGRINDIAVSFNKLAEELDQTEMLRGDFINNFSHEFKTPIVSIAGFAKLLRRGGLTQEQKNEYLGIIEEESLRLSTMATNVLSLTRVENQKILTDISKFNISEQVRSCVLLLEDHWVRKGIDFKLEFGEHHLFGNEEMLKQVFINLIHNAIKFSPAGSTVEIRITDIGRQIAVAVINCGSYIPPEDRQKIFGKFYQADTSHSGEGNGVGLAVVKKVVELHKGAVSLRSDERETAFTVTLPKKQNSNE